jgi:hypothetical protein
MAQPLLNTTELDFDQIKANLKAYFQRQDSPISDWNFDGSGLNMLLDVLAYNTHYNAILAHLNLNESFIDTAQLRSSVISQAKLLGYVPGSIKASTAVASLSLPSPGTPSFGSTLTIPAGTKFTGSSPNGTFTFINQSVVTAVYNTISSTSSAYTAPISLIQGVQRYQSYQVDNSIANQRFVIDDPSADITTLVVRVYDQQNSTNAVIYQNITDFIASNGGNLNSVTPTSPIYYLSLNSAGNYEVTFGDGVLGTALSNLNVVQLGYVSTQGPIANGITSFQFADSINDPGASNAPITSGTVTLISSVNGADSESIDSIRLNAPASLISQNRAVTANDYITILKKLYPATTAINVWGGEDEVAFDPINAAQYAGKVYIAMVPSESDVPTQIKPYKVMSVTPVVYPVDYINLYMNVNFKYNPNLTTQSPTDLQASIGNVISAYSSTSLQSFTGVFRSSNLLRQIDTSDPSILNSDLQLSFYKNYTINALTGETDVVTYGIQSVPNGLINTFGNTLYGSVNQVNSMVSSSGFSLSSVVMPSQQPIQVYGTYSSGSLSTVITLTSSPGTSTSATNNLTHPYLVVGSIVTTSASGFTSTTTWSISSINNTGSYSIITVKAATTSALTFSSTAYTNSSQTLVITPPGGTYYLRDGDDPASTTTRRLFMSLNSSSNVANDPKYTSTGSDIHIGTVYPSTGKIELYRYFIGTVTSVPSNTSMTDSAYGGVGAAWYTNQFANCTLYIFAGTGAGNTRTITTNSSNTLYWSSALTLDTTSQYMVIRSCIDATASTPISIYSRPASNDVAPSRHQLLTVTSLSSLINVTATPDTFAQSGVLGATNYSTFSRDP